MPKTLEEINEVIENGRRLVEKAREAIARRERYCAERGIDPDAAIEELRRQGGEAAVQAMQAEVQAALKKIEEEVRQERMHKSKARSAGKPARVRPNMV